MIEIIIPSNKLEWKKISWEEDYQNFNQLLLYDETMKSIIFLLGVCTFFCVAYASPASFQSYDRLDSLLDKITDKQSVSAETSNAIVQVIDRAAKESLNEKARAMFLGGLIKKGLSFLGWN